MISGASSFTPSPAIAPNSLPRAALALANVLYEKKGLIAYVTVNRPKVLNALNTPTWTDLQAAFEDAKADASVHSVILTGAGDKVFIAGADISELARSICARSTRLAGSVRDRERATNRATSSSVIATSSACRHVATLSLLVQLFSNEESANILPVPWFALHHCRFHGIGRLE